jgi:CBS-domain-containing membrane protein
MQVDAVMTRGVLTCGPQDPLNAAAWIMWDRDCGCVPVIEQEPGGARVVGMLTDRDVCMAAYTQGRSLADIPVWSAMASAVRSCRATDSTDVALEMLEQHRLHRLPVLDQDDHLVGMLSLADLAREAQREQTRSKKDVTDAQVGQALEAISQPRHPSALQTAA